MRKRNINNAGEKGFTILEAVIALAVLAIISGILLTGVSGVRRRAAVNNAAQEFASQVRETISMARNDVRAAGCEGEGRVCSTYYVEYFSNPRGQYDIFVDGDNGVTRVKRLYLTNGTNFSIPGGKDFDEMTISFAFPLVEVGGANSISLNADGEAMNVCVRGGGLVAVQKEAC